MKWIESDITGSNAYRRTEESVTIQRQLHKSQRITIIRNEQFGPSLERARISIGGGKEIHPASNVLPIHLPVQDYDGLWRLVNTEARFNHPVAELLRHKLTRAIVGGPEEKNARVVTMASRVRYRLDHDGKLESRDLVYPDVIRLTEDRLSILSPLGAALIGSNEGTSVSFRNLCGTLKLVTIAAVTRS